MRKITSLPPTRLTPEFVKRAVRPPNSARQVVCRDPSRPGFMIVISGENNVVSYAVQRHIRLGAGLKRSVRKTVGRADKITLTEAWRAGSRLLNDISDGVDPRLGQRVKGELTLGEALAKHLAEMRADGSSERNVKEFKAVFDRHFKDWLDVPLRTFGLDPDLLKTRQDKINNGRRCAASKPMRLFKAVYVNARDSNPKLALPEQPVRVLKLPEYDEVDDHLTPAQCKAWWRNVRKITNPIRRDFHVLSFFSGIRQNVASAARTEHFMPDEGVLMFPQMKNGTSFFLPLSAFLVNLLKRRVADNGEGEQWLFPALSRSGHIEEHDDDELVMKGAQGVEHCWTGRYLRHNYASHAAAAGLDESDIARLLHHKRGGVTGRYIHKPAMLKLMRGLQETVTAELLGAVGEDH